MREEFDHVRTGKHGADSREQVIAIGLAKARRAGIPLPPEPAPKRSPVKRTRTAAKRTTAKRPATKRAAKRPTAKRRTRR